MLKWWSIYSQSEWITSNTFGNNMNPSSIGFTQFSFSTFSLAKKSWFFLACWSTKKSAEKPIGDIFFSFEGFLYLRRDDIWNPYFHMLGAFSSSTTTFLTMEGILRITKHEKLFVSLRVFSLNACLVIGGILQSERFHGIPFFVFWFFFSPTMKWIIVGDELSSFEGFSCLRKGVEAPISIRIQHFHS